MTAASVGPPTQSTAPCQRCSSSAWCWPPVPAPDDAGRPELVQPAMRALLPGAGDHLVAAPGEERDRNGTDAARGARHEDGTLAGGEAVLFESEHAQGGREPRGARIIASRC